MTDVTIVVTLWRGLTPRHQSKWRKYWLGMLPRAVEQAARPRESGIILRAKS